MALGHRSVASVSGIGQWVVFGVVSSRDCSVNDGYNFYGNVVANLKWIKNV